MKIKTLYINAIRSLILFALCAVGAISASAASKYVVVIDAGHGGKDYGAIDNNLREKDINLAVALKVGDYIKKHSKNIKVVYTRTKDVYLTLQQRAEKANKAKADLFICIHTNSLAKDNPKRATIEGTSTYTLGLGKSDNNIAVARRENSVMTLEPNFETNYSGFDPHSDESYIIFEMAQKANMTNSLKFAELVQKQVSKMAHRKDNGVHQAGFWLLWATAMPSALIELDFICNPNSAKYLSSEKGENQLAKGIGSATVAYFKALEQQAKNRLRTDGDGDADDTFFGNEEGVVLASLTEEVKKCEAPQPKPTERTRRPANRRRRSDASREKSERQEYAEAVIREENVYVDHHTAIEEDTQMQLTAQAETDKHPKEADKEAKATAKQAKSKTGKNSNKSVTSAQPQKQDSKKQQDSKKVKETKPEAKKNEAPYKPMKDEQRADAGKSPVRMSKVTTVYKIQILSSSERLKAGSPLFQGLAPVTCIAEGDEYKYVYGESTNRNEIYHLLADVQKIIPDAQVIKVKKAL